MSSRERCVFVGPVVMVRGGVGGSPIGLQLSLALAGHRQSGVCRACAGINQGLAVVLTSTNEGVAVVPIV